MNVKDVYDWLETAGQSVDKRKVNLAIDLVREELAELEDGLFSDNKEEVIDALVDLSWVLCNVAYFYGITLEELKIHEAKVSVSNWSKFCKNEKEAVETCKAYQWGKHPDKLGQEIDCYYEQHGAWWIVKRKDEKILKSLKYIKVEEL